MRLLLVEDDPMIGASVQRGLRQDGHTVDWVRDGAAADLAVAAGVHELILLDLGLPGKSGLEWLAQWRARGVTLPVLILTARDAVADRVRGLDAGADDYPSNRSASKSSPPACAPWDDGRAGGQRRASNSGH